MQNAEEHDKPAESDRQNEEGIDERVLPDLHAQLAELIGQERDPCIHGKHAQKERDCARDRSRQDEGNKLALDAVAVGLQGEHHGGERGDERFEQQHIVGGKEVLRAERKAEHRQKDGKERLHNVERSARFDVVDDPPPLVHDVGEVEEVVVHQNEVRNVARRLAARRNGDRAVRLFEGENIVDAVARHGDRAALLFDGADEDRLLFGRHSAEYGVLRRDVLHLDVRQSVERDILPRVLHADAARHFRYGHGVVARDDLDVHVVFAEPFDRFDRVRADIVRKGDDRRRAEEGGQPPARNGVGRIGEQKHSEPRRRILFDDLVDLGRHGAEDKLGRAHRERTRVAEGDRRELALARKGNGRRRLQCVGVPETVVEGDRGLVVVFQRAQHTAHDLVERIIHIVIEDHAVVHRHSAVGDGARLIQTQHVDARQHFQRIQVLHERLFFGEPHDADRHGKRGEEQQPRRDHADDHGAGELNGEAHVRPRRLPVDPEHRRRDEGDHDADHADKEADGVHDLRLGFFILFRLGSERVEVGRLADLVGADAARAARNVRACVQRFADGFFDGNALARQERFVDFHDAVQQNAVGRDLLPRFQKDNVVQHNVAYGNLRPYPAAHDFRRRRDEHGELVDLPLCQKFLHDADDEVGGEDRHEEELREGRSGIGERHRDDQAQQVEEGADIADEDARVRLGIFLVDVVEEELRKARFHLLRRKSLIGRRLEAFHFLRGGNALGAAELFHERLARTVVLLYGVRVQHARGEPLVRSRRFFCGFGRGHGCPVFRLRLFCLFFQWGVLPFFFGHCGAPCPRLRPTPIAIIHRTREKVKISVRRFCEIFVRFRLSLREKLLFSAD